VTALNAAARGLGDRIGVLASGMEADLIAVEVILVHVERYLPVRFSIAWMTSRLFITHVRLSNPDLAQTSM